jgi:hypothetical protein
LRLSIAATIVLVLCAIAAADDIIFVADVSTTQPSVGEQVKLELTISGGVENLPAPNTPVIPGCRVFGAGTSQQFSFVNGEVASSVTHTYLVVPQQTGKIVIPPQELSIKGKNYATAPITLTVSSGNATTRRQDSGRSAETSRQTQSGRGGDRDFFVETFVDKDTAYVNEQVTLTFRFYQGKRLFSEPEYKPPSATGFWVEDLPPQKNFYKTVNSRNYYVAEVKTALFPTSPGAKTVGKATLKIGGEDLLSLFDRDPFGVFQRRRSQPKPVNLESKPIEIVVLPLPSEGRPADFSGSVGQFKMFASIDKTEVEVNQPLTVKIKLSGTGNIKTLAEPLMPQLDEFRVFNSGKSENVSKAGYVVGGSKTFETTFVPKEPGSYTISIEGTTYFDPKTGEYKRLSGKSFEISVLGVSNEEIAAHTGLLPGRLDLVAKDIRYIFTDRRGSSDSGKPYVFSPWFIFLNALPIAGLVAVFVLRRHRDRLAGDVGYRRLRRAVKMAKTRLSSARNLLRQNDASGFYTEVSRALSEYVGDKFNISAHGLTLQQAGALFDDKRVAPELRQQFADILAECDEGRFSKSSSAGDEMNDTLSKAERWIVEFEGVSK